MNAAKPVRTPTSRTTPLRGRGLWVAAVVVLPFAATLLAHPARAADPVGPAIEPARAPLRTTATTNSPVTAPIPVVSVTTTDGPTTEPATEFAPTMSTPKPAIPVAKQEALDARLRFQLEPRTVEENGSVVRHLHRERSFRGFLQLFDPLAPAPRREPALPSAYELRVPLDHMLPGSLRGLDTPPLPRASIDPIRHEYGIGIW